MSAGQQHDGRKRLDEHVRLRVRSYVVEFTGGEEVMYNN